MASASYTVYRNGEQIEAGYDVEDVCNRDDCTTEIDRGADYLCGRTPGGDEHGCGHYFCDEHLYCGDESQLCESCRDRRVAERLDEFADLVAATLRKLDGVKTAFVEQGQPRIHVELTDGFEITLQASQ